MYKSSTMIYKRISKFSIITVGKQLRLAANYFSEIFD